MAHIVRIPALTLRVDDAPDSTSAIFMAAMRLHGTLSQCAKAEEISDEGHVDPVAERMTLVPSGDFAGMIGARGLSVE